MTWIFDNKILVVINFASYYIHCKILVTNKNCNTQNSTVTRVLLVVNESACWLQRKSGVFLRKYMLRSEKMYIRLSSRLYPYTNLTFGALLIEGLNYKCIVQFQYNGWQDATDCANDFSAQPEDIFSDIYCKNNSNMKISGMDPQHWVLSQGCTIIRKQKQKENDLPQNPSLSMWSRYETFHMFSGCLRAIRIGWVASHFFPPDFHCLEMWPLDRRTASAIIIVMDYE